MVFQADMNFSWYPFILSLKLAAITTVSLLVIGLPLAYFIHFRSSNFTPFLKSMVSLPLVLPPTVMGYYLLLILQPEGLLGKLFLGTNLAFTFPGLVIGSIIFSCPFMINPILSGLENLPSNLTDAALTLGKSKISTFWNVLIPNIRPSIVIGSVMAFAHTVGEFGMVLMIGGNIPGKTRVASIAVYNEVERMDYASADLYATVLLIFSLLVLLLVYTYQHKRKVAFL